jgi:hypothetical protein
MILKLNQKSFFKREKYNFDLIRIHHFLLDKLDIQSINQSSSSNKSISYQYNNYLIPTGVLKIWKFEAIEFRKLPATALQFFYLNKSNGKSLSYIDFNKFNGTEQRQLDSNTFRLIIEGINSRVSKNTKNVVEEIILLERSKETYNDTNRYKWNEKLESEG